VSIFAQPRHRLRCITRPTVDPLTLEEVVLHLRLDPEAKDGPEKPLLESMIKAATRTCENYASIAIMDQVWQMTLGHWPWTYGSTLRLPFPPFRSLTRIEMAGDPQDLANFNVEADEVMSANLYPVGGYWHGNTMWRDPQRIVIEFQCGHERVEDVPPDIKQALLMAIAFWYEQRESQAQFALHPVLELGWAGLLSTYRDIGMSA
jgi:uncharacterized phiE125 gp8 family phage protein